MRQVISNPLKNIFGRKIHSTGCSSKMKRNQVGAAATAPVFCLTLV
tara:strand:- start:2694 stop:2831 length:138 start_codon:yes stop_codon:yes gene_type:complete